MVSKQNASGAYKMQFWRESGIAAQGAEMGDHI